MIINRRPPIQAPITSITIEQPKTSDASEKTVFITVRGRSGICLTVSPKDEAVSRQNHLDMTRTEELRDALDLILDQENA